MSIHHISQAAKMDVAASFILLICIVVVAVSLEVSAPVIAGIASVGAAATGVVRVFYKGSRPNR